VTVASGRAPLKERGVAPELPPKQVYSGRELRHRGGEPCSRATPRRSEGRLLETGRNVRAAALARGQVTRSMFDRYNIVSENDLLRIAAQETRCTSTRL
jgi:hypothetical protein